MVEGDSNADENDTKERVTEYRSYFPCTSNKNAVARVLNNMQLPVDEDDMIMFEGVANIYQTFVFCRYQIRTLAKFMN